GDAGLEDIGMPEQEAESEEAAEAAAEDADALGIDERKRLEVLDALKLVGHFDEAELACDGGFELVTARRFAGAAAIDGIDDVAVLRHHLRPEVGDVDPLVDDGPGAAAGRRSAMEVDD